MNEPYARTLLEDAVRDLEVSRAPSGDLVVQGRRRHRITRLAQVGGVVAAVVLITSGALWLADDDAAHRGSPQPAGPTPTTTTSPSGNENATPAGNRLVAYGPIAVTVPSSWETDRIGCRGGVVEDAVVFEPSRHDDCPLVQGDFSSVHFGPIDSWTPQPKAFDALSIETIGSVEVQRSGVGWLFQYGGGGVTKEMRAAVLFIPSADVVMWVQSPDPAVVERVMDSVQAVPDG